MAAGKGIKQSSYRRAAARHTRPAQASSLSGARCGAIVREARTLDLAFEAFYRSSCCCSLRFVQSLQTWSANLPELSSSHLIIVASQSVAGSLPYRQLAHDAPALSVSNVFNKILLL
jgi:hypothetical protein